MGIDNFSIGFCHGGNFGRNDARRIPVTSRCLVSTDSRAFQIWHAIWAKVVYDLLMVWHSGIVVKFAAWESTTLVLVSIGGGQLWQERLKEDASHFTLSRKH